MGCDQGRAVPDLDAPGGKCRRPLYRRPQLGCRAEEIDWICVSGEFVLDPALICGLGCNSFRMVGPLQNDIAVSQHVRIPPFAGREAFSDLATGRRFRATSSFGDGLAAVAEEAVAGNWPGRAGYKAGSE